MGNIFSFRGRRSNSPENSEGRRERVNRTPPVSECGACYWRTVINKNHEKCKGCSLTPYFPLAEYKNADRIRKKIGLKAMRTIVKKHHDPVIVKRKMEKKVKAAKIQKSIGVLKLKEKHDAAQQEIAELKKMLKANYDLMMHQYHMGGGHAHGAHMGSGNAAFHGMGTGHAPNGAYMGSGNAAFHGMGTGHAPNGGHMGGGGYAPNGAHMGGGHANMGGWRPPF